MNINRIFHALEKVEIDDGPKVVMPRPKETITIRLDADVVEWFRGSGKGYQTRINAILRSYMHARGDGDVSGE